MKSLKEKLEIEYLKSLTYTEINEKMNMLNDKINELEKALQLKQSNVIDSNCIDESPETRINVNKFDEKDYYDGKFLK